MIYTVNHSPLYCYTGGKAFDPAQPTAVFIHGVAGDHSVWALQSRSLAHHGWNVLAIDLPGHGRSGGHAPESVQEAAQAVCALLDAVGAHKAALIGHSWGSLIALQAAAQLGARASHLVLVGSAYPMRVSPALLDSALNTPEKALHTMREQTQRMEGLVKQLLTLSRIEAAPALAMNDRIDVPMMLRVVEREAQTLSQEKQTLIFTVDEQLKVLGNEEQLRSAISNLVYNAVNHTPPGTEIRVSWQRTPQGALFSVEDNGPGIAPEHIPRLTERFYRVDKARSRQTGGSGLGLAIVKHAVNHHDSRLEIDSTVGKGTRFSFLLPERLIAKNDA